MAKIEKVIQLVELKKDLEQLMGQSHAISGAIQYIQQKIALLEVKKDDAPHSE